MELARAKKHIRNAGIAGLVWCVIILIGLFQNPGFNANLFSLILVLALAFGTFAKSRFCAVLMFIFFLLTLGTGIVVYFIKFGIVSHLLYFIGAVIFLGGFGYFLVMGIIGTFAYHFLISESEGESTSPPDEEKTETEK